ncbi:MAG TPA: hypothetical protein VE029_08230, partial [Rhizobacter sp.]|nr:hypothetical protein [Rhizobacter sp.]
PQVSLFAPITATALGQGRWGRATPPARTPDVQAAREQAALAWRMTVQSRLGSLAENLARSGYALHCEVGLRSEPRAARLRCARESDQGLVWSFLQGVASADKDLDAPADICLQLDTPQGPLAQCAPAPLTLAALPR